MARPLPLPLLSGLATKKWTYFAASLSRWQCITLFCTPMIHRVIFTLYLIWASCRQEAESRAQLVAEPVRSLLQVANWPIDWPHTHTIAAGHMSLSTCPPVGSGLSCSVHRRTLENTCFPDLDWPIPDPTRKNERIQIPDWNTRSYFSFVLCYLMNSHIFLQEI